MIRRLFLLGHVGTFSFFSSLGDAWDALITNADVLGLSPLFGLGQKAFIGPVWAWTSVVKGLDLLPMPWCSTSSLCLFLGHELCCCNADLEGLGVSSLSLSRHAVLACEFVCRVVCLFLVSLHLL